MINLRIPYFSPMKFYSDKKSAISITHNPVHHNRTKHVEIDHHFIREKIEEGIISLSHVSTKFQEVGVLTKAALRSGFEFFIGKQGMIDIYSPA